MALLIAVTTTASANADPARPPPARLEGTFSMAGRVTVAHHVAGEHVGQHVSRVWTFTPLCPTGPCPTVQLVRARATGTDTVVLDRQSDGSYTGKGRFYLPLRCAGRPYLKGELVPFKITVKVTRTATVGGVVVAQSLTASYRNRVRKNLTPCVAVLGHDAASYSGTLGPPPA